MTNRKSSSPSGGTSSNSSTSSTSTGMSDGQGMNSPKKSMELPEEGLKDAQSEPENVPKNAYGFYDADHAAPGGYNIPPSSGPSEFTPDAKQAKADAAKEKEGQPAEDTNPASTEGSEAKAGKVQGKGAMGSGMTGTDKPTAPLGDQAISAGEKEEKGGEKGPKNEGDKDPLFGDEKKPLSDLFKDAAEDKAPEKAGNKAADKTAVTSTPPTYGGDVNKDKGGAEAKPHVKGK